MRKLDFYCGEPHFFDHTSPIWLKLPEQYRGTFYVNGDETIQRAKDAKIEFTVGYPTDNLCLVASIADYRATKGDVIFMEHGIGNTYSNGHAGYAGGLGKDRAVLFLNQHHLTDEKNRLAYPNAKHAIIGTPKMDSVPEMKVREGKKTVCLSFHWDCHIAPETQSTFWDYKRVIPVLQTSNDFNFILHAHPKVGWQETVLRESHFNGKFYPKFADVLTDADIYIMDNSSTIYEFAYTGKPVIILNMHKYRLEVNHGIRFWDYLVGEMVWRPKDLYGVIMDTIADPDRFKTQREEVIKELYPYKHNATGRAVTVLIDFLEGRD